MPETPSIPSNIHWDDPAIYQWSLFCKKNVFFETGGYILGVVFFFPWLVFLPFWLLGLVLPKTTAWIAILIVAFMIYCIIFGFYLQAFGSPKNKIKSGWNTASCAVFTFALIYFLLSQPHSILTRYFENTQGEGYVGWFLYLFDRTCEVVLLDFPKSVFAWEFSNIREIGIVGKAIKFLVKFLITAGVFQVIVLVWKLRYTKQTTFIGTIRELYWHCEIIPHQKEVEISLAGKFAPVEFQWETSANEVLSLYKNGADGDTDDA